MSVDIAKLKQQVYNGEKYGVSIRILRTEISLPILATRLYESNESEEDCPLQTNGDTLRLVITKKRSMLEITTSSVK